MPISALQFEPQILGQLRPIDTVAASIHSPTSISILRGILICNTTTSIAKFRLFVNNSGTTYDETTTVAWDIPVGAGEFLLVETLDGLALNNPAANIAVRTDTASALTFTLYGDKKVLQ